jgi:hypothetical protein
MPVAVSAALLVGLAFTLTIHRLEEHFHRRM